MRWAHRVGKQTSPTFAAKHGVMTRINRRPIPRSSSIAGAMAIPRRGAGIFFPFVRHFRTNTPPNGLSSSELFGGEEIAGTVHYIAPELWRGAPASIQSDLYAVGVIIRQLMTADMAEMPTMEMLPSKATRGASSPMPSFRTPTSGLGISTRLTGSGS